MFLKMHIIGICLIRWVSDYTDDTIMWERFRNFFYDDKPKKKKKTIYFNL